MRTMAELLRQGDRLADGGTVLSPSPHIDGDAVSVTVRYDNREIRIRSFTRGDGLNVYREPVRPLVVVGHEDSNDRDILNRETSRYERDVLGL